MRVRDVLGGDRRLQPVAAGRRRRGERAALLDLAGVPQRAVLVGEQDEPPLGVDARVAARVVEQHQRQQAARLGPAGHQLDAAGGRAGSPRRTARAAPAPRPPSRRSPR